MHDESKKHLTLWAIETASAQHVRSEARAIALRGWKWTDKVASLNESWQKLQVGAGYHLLV